MRYSLFVYLYKMCGSFQEATEYIVKNPGANRQLLSDCVEGLNAVDTVLQKNPESVLNPQVQEYLSKCKLKCQELLNEGADANQEKKVQLSWNMAAFRKVFREGISIQYKVVFFAEMGQKWDSMSSVYEAFRTRDDCEVAVVITPIFRATTVDGIKKGDVIYEDYLTPMDIPNIPYEFYDLSKERPDMAFISNPYESVTLEQFWPENIAKYTRLVYLPYYTGMVISKHSIMIHCCAPVTSFSWMILAQSKKMRQLHVKFSDKHGKNVLVTGLPKWDNISQQNISNEIPQEWLKKLNGKKVFLWNSHFPKDTGSSTLFELSEPILELFQNRRDIALIWRPHPMTEMLIQMYLPDCLENWKRLKELANSSDNIIIDTNTFYDVAFHCSDAMISDLSSLMVQYLFMDKPLLFIENEECDLQEEDKIKGYLVNLNQLERAKKIDQIEAFVKSVLRGEDTKKEVRKKIIQEDLPFSDGHIGERVCSLLLKKLLEEDLN